jgi:hypothetical protein
VPLALLVIDFLLVTKILSQNKIIGTFFTLKNSHPAKAGY